MVCQHGLEGRPQRRRRSEDRLALLPPLRGQTGRAGLRHLFAAEPLHRAGPLPRHPAQGASAEAGAVLLHPGAAPAHTRLAGGPAVRRSRPDRLLRAVLRRQDRRARSAAARSLRALDLLGRLQRVGLEEHQRRIHLQLHAHQRVRHDRVRFRRMSSITPTWPI